jgi:hypothetical protein
MRDRVTSATARAMDEKSRPPFYARPCRGTIDVTKSVPAIAGYYRPAWGFDVPHLHSSGLLLPGNEHHGALCEVDDCNRMATMIVRLQPTETDDGLVGLCEYHTRQTDELFPGSGIIRYPNKSKVDWHDRMYNEGVPDHILKSRSNPERSRRWF